MDLRRKVAVLTNRHRAGANAAMKFYPHQPHLTLPKYRRDIDGLRAIAVISVVVFHAFPEVLRGGFTGVDIFFVISGYLISTIVLTSLENGTFSFAEFYSRRIRRIFPALILVLCVSYGIGWLVLNDAEFTQLGLHIAGASIFASNFLLFSEVGYFDSSAAAKPLIHLWSLGIEEQFYLFLPFSLWLLRSKRNLLALLIAAYAISFSFNIWFYRSDQPASFYLPQCRFWELLAGSILAYISNYRPILSDNFRRLVYFNYMATSEVNHRHIESIAGLMLIAIGLVFTNDTAFPGWWSLLPAMGSVLIIGSGQQAIVNRALFSNKLLVLIGLISFPLYLWHWPLISFARIVVGPFPSIAVPALAVGASFVLACLTYLCIERPVRFSLQMSAATAPVSAAILAVVGISGYVIVLENGVPDRAAVNLNYSLQQDPATDPAIFKKCEIPELTVRGNVRACVQDVREPPKYALLGDSKAQAAFSGFFRSSTSKGRWIFVGGAGGPDFPKGPVLPNLSDDELNNPSDSASSIAFEAIAADPNVSVVILMNAVRNFFPVDPKTLSFDYGDARAQEAFVRGYGNTAKRLARVDKKVIIVLDIPTRREPRDCITRTTAFNFLNHIIEDLKEINKRECYLSLKDHKARTKKYRELLNQIEANNSNVAIFDTTQYMCDVAAGKCPQERNGRSLYSYADHMSDYASRLIGTDLNRYLSTDSFFR